MGKLTTAKMIPLKKPLLAFWWGDREGGGQGYVEKETLPTGTLCGDLRVEKENERMTILSFTAMPSPGIFKRYRKLLKD